jgi:hypothetical protein
MSSLTNQDMYLALPTISIHATISPTRPYMPITDRFQPSRTTKPTMITDSDRDVLMLLRKLPRHGSLSEQRIKPCLKLKLGAALDLRFYVPVAITNRQRMCLYLGTMICLA